MDSIAPVSSSVPVSYTSKNVEYKTREGRDPGELIVTATTYEVTVYDKNGKLESTTSVHQTDYTV